MKKVNFNSLENFEVPEEWIEKALNAKPKKKILFRPYVLGTAASLVLVTVLSLILFKPFQKISTPPPVIVSTIEPSLITEETINKDATKETTAEAATEKTESTEVEPSEEDPVDSQGDPIDNEEIEPKNDSEPEATESTYTPSKFRVDNNWEYDTSQSRPTNANASAHGESAPIENAIIPNAIPKTNASYPYLSKDELFTGDITIIVSPDSPYYDKKVFYLGIEGYYSGKSDKISGTVILDSIQEENEEKTITFNLFYMDIYIPSTDYSFLFYFEDDNGSRVESQKLTVPLYSDNSVTITI